MQNTINAENNMKKKSEFGILKNDILMILQRMTQNHMVILY